MHLFIWKLNNALSVNITLFFGTIWFSFLVSFILINKNKYFMITAGSEQSIKGLSIEAMSDKNEFPVRMINLLDQHEYCDNERSGKSYNRSVLKKEDIKSIPILRYTAKSVVACLDVLYLERISKKKKNIANYNLRSPELHFVFMGDSRIRQQFIYFLRLIPDYDWKMHPTQPTHHGEVDVDFKMFGLRVSFKWQPVINNNTLRAMQKWALSDKTEQPTFILLGMAVHHMLKRNGANFQFYNTLMREFAKIIDNCDISSEVIWLNQYPTNELYADNTAVNTEIHSEKIHQYNEAVRHVFKNSKNVRVWDSSNLLTEEYIRGCTVSPEREIFSKSKIHSFFETTSYIECQDFVHIGYVALSGAIQLLYNNLCNANVCQHTGYSILQRFQ